MLLIPADFLSLVALLASLAAPAPTAPEMPVDDTTVIAEVPSEEATAEAPSEEATAEAPADYVATDIASPDMKTCVYATNWGEMTLYYYPGNGQFAGRYEYESGMVSGQHLAGERQLMGQWFEANGSGMFVFDLTPAGFTGRWNSFQDADWRTDWEGVASLGDCFQ